jgi:Protein of unknown function (DUF2933)
MQYILSLLPVLACPVGMGLMIWFMMRGSKNQSPDVTAREQTPLETRSVSVRVPATPRQESPITPPSSPLKAIVDCVQMCLNWKVLAGLAVVGVGIWIVAPQFAFAALPVLLVAVCPLSMLLMMRGMAGNRNATAQMQGEQLPAGLTRDERLAELQSRMSSMQDEQETIARQIAEIESPEVPIVSEAEAVASEASERNRKSTANRRR